MSLLRVTVLVAGVALPALTLIPFGSLWLWQNGYLLHWALAAVGIAGVTVLVQWRLFRPLTPAPMATDASSAPSDLVEPTWSPAEQQAWSDVVAIAARIDVAKLTTRDAVIELGLETVRAVASRLHPGVTDPLWQFTVPEAFALLERVSRRLGVFTAESIPLSDRLTVARALSLYRWRGAIEVAETAYDVWRVVRLANPLTAATQEMRERLSRQMLQWGRDHVSQRLAHAYVTEIGRAAIDLYGGRLRVSARHVQDQVSAAGREDGAAIVARDAEPLRILIAGQPGVGKSSLVNALAREVRATVDAVPATADFTAYDLRGDGLVNARLIDSPGLTSSPTAATELLAQAVNCDLVVWVVAAHRADREIDRRAISALRETFARLVDRGPPPLLLVVTHIDRLRPFQEWSPPYDLQVADRPKAAAIRAAMEAAAADLSFRLEQVVPVRLAHGATYNIDALWAALFLAMPEARRAHLLRKLQDAHAEWNWGRIWTQATTAGRVIGRTLRS